MRGQLITGYPELPGIMEPKSLYLPAAATNTTEMLSPSYSVLNLQVSSGSLWELLVKVHMGFNISKKLY